MAPNHVRAMSDLRSAFPAGPVLHNPVTGEYARLVSQTAEQGIGEMVAVPGAAVAARLHPGQDERFEVLEGLMAYRAARSAVSLLPASRSRFRRESSMTGGTLATPTSRRASRCRRLDRSQP